MPEEIENLEEETGQEAMEGTGEPEVTPDQEALQYLQSIDTSLLQIKESLQGVQNAPPQDAEEIQKTLDSILLQVTEKSEAVSVDYSEKLQEISGSVQNGVKISILILFAVGVVAGIVTGKIMWGKINAG